MIEKYLQLGVRFRWAKPDDVVGPHDGAIVNGVRPTAALKYIGLGSVVSPQLMAVNVRTLGLQMNLPVPHKWLDYALGRTAQVRLGPADVLTGFMSGCIIARWTHLGVNYAGHVGTIESDPAVNRLVRHTFANAMPATTTGFSPADAWQFDELAALMGRLKIQNPPKICAVVTATGSFYSAVMFADGANEWYCGGIKRAMPIPYTVLRQRMLAP